MDIQGVSTRSQVLEYENTVVVTIGSIVALIGFFAFYIWIAVCLDNLILRVTQNDLRAIDRVVNIVTSTTLVVRLVDLFIFGTNCTHDITLRVCSVAKIVLDTAEIANTFLAAPVWVQCAVTSWLISVEITLGQCTWTTVAQYTIVPTVHTQTTLDVHIGHRVVARVLKACIVDLKHTLPNGFLKWDRTRVGSAAVVTTVDEQ